MPLGGWRAQEWQRSFEVVSNRTAGVNANIYPIRPVTFEALWASAPTGRGRQKLRVAD